MSLWTLAPDITYLNHGSYGACPRSVLLFQSQLRARMEANPMRFFRQYGALLEEAQRAVATFVGADVENLVFVPNATFGVNCVLKSLALSPGDELLTTQHAYNACRNALDFVAQKTGARVVVAKVPFPLKAATDISSAILECVTPRTRLAMLDHITSPTGLVFPIAALVKSLNERGIDTLVDGAHAPGMVPLQLEALGASYYTGNLHKWVCAPKGAAFLHVRKDKQAHIHPLAQSHGMNAPLSGKSRFQKEFEWTGTDDLTPYLSVPEALRFLESLDPLGIEGLMKRNRQRVLEGRKVLLSALEVEAPCPEEVLGSLATLPLPSGPWARAPNAGQALELRLSETYGIEVPIIFWPDTSSYFVRISAQHYNHPPQYEYLAQSLKELMTSQTPSRGNS